jgi:DNA-binding MarR family transcriptional regulator
MSNEKEKVYFETIMVIERLHHLFFDALKAELNRQSIKDINNMQCFILYNIGTSQLTTGEISNRGYYLGSNVTYNLKKMIDNGYVLQEKCICDKRLRQIKLSHKGIDLYKKMNKVFVQDAENMKNNNLSEIELKTAAHSLAKLESFWRTGH